MPVSGGGGYGGGGSTPYIPPPPPVAPPPPSPGPALSAPPTHTDASLGGGNYGGNATDAFKATPAYANIVSSVFRAQPPAQKQAILQGALSNPTAEGQIVLNYVRQVAQSNPFDPVLQGLSHDGNIWDQLGHAGSSFINDLGGAAHGALSLIPAPNFRNNATGNFPLPGQQAIDTGVGAANKLINMIPTRPPSGPGEQLAAREGLGPGALGKNLAKDAVNLYAEALPSIAMPVGTAISGHPQKALDQLTGFYKQIFNDPTQAFIQHPLLSALAFAGPLHAATRGLAAPVRAVAPAESAIGRALSTKREGVHLTGNLTHERPPYSPYPLLKMSQASIERSLLYDRAPTGELVPKSRQVQEHLIRANVADLAAMHESIRRAARQAVISQRIGAVQRGLPMRAGKATAQSLARNPSPSLIPGADVLARIADGTIRRPDTYVQDLRQHLADVSATRSNLLDNKALLKQHDAYVAGIERAIKNAPTKPKQLQAIFAAADKYGQDFAPLEQTAGLKYGHWGEQTSGSLLRRALMHYAYTHMGARWNEEHGLVAPTGAPLATEEILKHLHGPEGTGGRKLAYTPDYPKQGSAFYVPSERRPLPRTAKNTLFAYSHGLTDPSHEALLEHHLRIQGAVNAHQAQNETLRELAVQKPGGGFWGTYRDAAADGRRMGLVPINTAEPFHPQASLAKAMEGVNPVSTEHIAARHALDLSERLRETPGAGRWALVDPYALRALKEQRDSISPNVVSRAFRGVNNAFRSVALSTSAKHIPGVTAEHIIRDISYGVGFRSWVTGRRVFARAEKLQPGSSPELKARMLGGHQAGSTLMARTYSTAEHYRGTNLYPVLKGIEELFKTPGPRQLRSAWKAWSNFVIMGTKRALEQEHQKAAVGKLALMEHGYVQSARSGGFLGATGRLLTLHGQMLDDAARGLFDPRKARQFRAYSRRVYGHWNDLTPTGKMAVMYSPFGLWWINSVRFLARMPVDQPVKTSLLASAEAGTQQQRQKAGLDMLGAGALPPYKQGGIPLSGGRILAQNYYSPFGVANDPLATLQSLTEPWLTQDVLFPATGLNYLGRPLNWPGNPHGNKEANFARRVQYMTLSLAGSFLPLWSKAESVMAGGASQFDLSNHFPLTATKTPGGGIQAGLTKAFLPWRMYGPSGPKKGHGRRGSEWGSGLGGGTHGARGFGSGGSKLFSGG